MTLIPKVLSMGWKPMSRQAHWPFDFAARAVIEKLNDA